jgi:hypothetical protein
MAQTNFTPISLYYSTTAAAVPTAGNLVPGELAININDGKLYYENSSGVVTLLAAAAGASGDVVGPASATDTAVALFDGTTGKLIKNSLVTIGSTGNTIISGTDNSNAMLRITQLGTGNALLVEDNTNPDSSPFVIDATGNVGIGTSSPTSKLEVAGTSVNQKLTATTGAAFTTYGNSGSNFFVGKENNAGSAFGAPAYASVLYEQAAYPIILYTNSQERMRIDSAGNVGIGTSSPTAKLTVVSGTNGGLFVTDGTVNGVVYASSGPQMTVGTVSNHNLQLFTNNSQKMVIDTSGNVGIGTASPSAQLQVAGSSSVSALKIPNIEEVATVSATAATGTINYDITTQSVLFYTSNASANWTVNFRGSSGTSLNTLMATGESMSASFLVTQGATAYYNSAVQVDGTTSGVTTRWQGSAPTSGNASSLDSYTYVIIKTANATFTVLATQTKFA